MQGDSENLAENKLVEIDGSLLEGGGQILRNAISLSVLLELPIKIINIRAKRDKPGLKEQHLKGIELMSKICNGTLQGAMKGSQVIEFHPSSLQGGNYEVLISTAGSISLILQIALPALLFANQATQLTIEGGTNAEMAPQFDYMTEVFCRNLDIMGATFDFDVIRRGYFPKGGGKVKVFINPITKLQPLILEDMGKIEHIQGWSFVAGRLPMQVAYEMAGAARDVLQKIHNKIDIECYQEAPNIAPVGTCAGIILVAYTSTGCILGSSALIKRNERGKDTGIRAGDELLQCLRQQCCLDSYTQDQMIIYMALASGKSRVKVGEITLHTRTSIYIMELLTQAKFKIEPCGSNNIIECDGISFKR